MKRTIKADFIDYRIALFACATVFVSLFACTKVNAETAEGKQIMVSLGDSYSSGEGIEPFYGQDLDTAQKVQNPDWLAHRSTKSWPGRLKLPTVSGTMAENKDVYWYFGAVSGAVTADLYGHQEKLFNKNTGSVTGDVTLAPQLDYFNLVGKNETDYVTLTLGGNDADFTGIIRQVAMSCVYLETNTLADKINNALKDFSKPDGLGDKLRNAYKSIAERAGGQAKIIVAGYPQLLDPEGAKYIFKTISALPPVGPLGGLNIPYGVIGEQAYYSAADIVNAGVTYFDLAIETIVKQCQKRGMNIHFVSVEDDFVGHQAFSADPFINGIFLIQSEDLNDNLLSPNYNPISSYSIHPNSKGASIYAECVQRKINELEDGGNIEAEKKAQPLSAKDLTWILEPTLEYDDVEPVWSPDFSDVGVPPSGQEVADANADIFSGDTFGGAEMNFPAYSCLEEYYAVHRGNESRLFYMPSQQESPFYDFTSERNWFVFDSTGIMYDLRSDHPYFDEWLANGGDTYGFPWNILTTGARGGGGVELLWDKASQKAYFVFGGEGIWRMRPAGLSDLHKLYAIREAEGTGQLPAQEAITYSEETGQIASLKGVGKYAIWAPDKGVITDFIYDEVSTGSYGLIAVSKDGKWGYLDENGNEVTPLEFDGVWQTSVSDMDYETNSQGYILSTIYHYNLQAYPCTSDTIVVSKSGELGVLYRDGTLLIEYGQFEDMAPAWNNQLWAKKDGKWGLIDLTAAKQKAGLPECDISQPFQEATEEEHTDNTVFSGLDVQPDIVMDSGERRQCEVTANPSLILRRGPGTEYERIDTIPYGSLVEEIGRSNETDAWIFTQYNGMVGWVSTQYLDYKTPSNGVFTGNNDSLYSVSGTNIVLTFEVKDNEIAITKCNPEAEGILEIPRTIHDLPVTSIGVDSMTVAFSGCNHITKVILPDTIKTIERISFWKCHNLESVFIPRSVTYIGTDVFDHCIRLTDIYYEGSEEDWQNIDIGDSNMELKEAAIHFNAVR